MIRRLDHIAVLVADTAAALIHFRGRLGLQVVQVDEPDGLGVRLTYLDCGNAWIQLVEPTAPGPLREDLERGGEGLHHVCFGVEDVAGAAAALAVGEDVAVRVGSGRGRPSAFVPAPALHGTRLEVTAYSPGEDDSRGAL